MAQLNLWRLRWGRERENEERESDVWGRGEKERTPFSRSGGIGGWERRVTSGGGRRGQSAPTPHAARKAAAAIPAWAGLTAWGGSERQQVAAGPGGQRRREPLGQEALRTASVACP